MFDDVQPPKSGNTPPNLPIGEPEDIFDAADSDQGSQDSAPTQDPTYIPEPSVLANTALDAGILKPKIDTNPLGVSVSPSRPSIEPVVPRPMSESAQQPYTMHTPSAPFLAEERGVMENQMGVPQEAPFSGRKILMIIITLVILIVIGFGSLWIYTSFIKKNTTENNFIPTDTTPSVTLPDTIVTIPDSTTVNPTSTNPEDSILFGEPVDTDSDGIIDVDEVEFGTNTLNWDTDVDGLSDGDEVMVWQTNPLIFDTDSDGYSDGVEVSNGYSPTGPGKLFETSTSTPTTAAVSTTSP